MDPFHVVQGITDTLDEVRCKEWQVAQEREGPARGQGAEGGRRRDQGQPLRACSGPGS
jgi:hypothetical protein